MRNPFRRPAVQADSNSDAAPFAVNYPDYSVALHSSPSPMMNYGGLETWKGNRRPSQSDVDGYPTEYRRFVNASGAQDVQLINGLQRGIAAGKRINYAGAGYLYAVVPQIPGQTRGDAGGFHKRGPSPLNMQTMWESGPGSQPDNPGGPGKIAGPIFYNPMTG